MLARRGYGLSLRTTETNPPSIRTTFMNVSSMFPSTATPTATPTSSSSSSSWPSLLSSWTWFRKFPLRKLVLVLIFLSSIFFSLYGFILLETGKSQSIFFTQSPDFHPELKLLNQAKVIPSNQGAIQREIEMGMDGEGKDTTSFRFVVDTTSQNGQSDMKDMSMKALPTHRLLNDNDVKRSVATKSKHFQGLEQNIALVLDQVQYDDGNAQVDSKLLESAGPNSLQLKLIEQSKISSTDTSVDSASSTTLQQQGADEYAPAWSDLDPYSPIPEAKDTLHPQPKIIEKGSMEIWPGQHSEDLTFNPLETTPFAKLRLCRKENAKLACVGNDECANSTCVHFQKPKNSTSRVFAKEVDLSKGRLLQRELKKTHESRLQALQSILKEMAKKFPPPSDQTRIVMGFNRGYAYFFGNWVESLVQNGVDLFEMQRRTIIIATDEGAREMVSLMGFFAFDSTPLLTWTVKRVIERAAGKFGDGAHGHVNVVVKFSMLHDLLELGYDVLVMDSDMVFMKNPVPPLQQFCRERRCHGAFVTDSRAFSFITDTPQALRDGSPSALFRLSFGEESNLNETYPTFNTGFFFMPSTPRTKRFMDMMLETIHLQQWKATDQLIFNMVLYHTVFQDMRWFVLPLDVFVGGGALHSHSQLKFEDTAHKAVILHASDAGHHLHKVAKLCKINQWYMLNGTKAFESCARIQGCFHKRFQLTVEEAEGCRSSRSSTSTKRSSHGSEVEVIFLD